MSIGDKAQELLDLIMEWKAGPHGKDYLKDELELFLGDRIEECAKIADQLKTAHENASNNDLYTWESRRHARGCAVVAAEIARQIRAVAL